MLRRILVPLDGSSFGEHALPHAIALARRHGATLDLAHVHEVASLVYMEGVPQIDASLELDGIRSDRSYLDRTLDRVVATGVEAGAVLLEGPTVGALEEHADASGADLIVMTTHGRGPLSRAWLGSVADGLARHSSRPVLLVRPPNGAGSTGDLLAPDAPRPALDAGIAPLRRMLIALDGTDASASVVDAALDVIPADGAVVLLHVAPPAVVVGAHVFHLEPQRQAEFVAAAQEGLQDVADGLAERIGDATTDVVLSADVAVAILEAAGRHDADAIALATHARGEIARLVFGSVTDKVLRGATLPVLIRRPDRTAPG